MPVSGRSCPGIENHLGGHQLPMRDVLDDPVAVGLGKIIPSSAGAFDQRIYMSHLLLLLGIGDLIAGLMAACKEGKRNRCHTTAPGSFHFIECGLLPNKEDGGAAFESRRP